MRVCRVLVPQLFLRFQLFVRIHSHLCLCVASPFLDSFPFPSHFAVNKVKDYRHQFRRCCARPDPHQPIITAIRPAFDRNQRQNEYCRDTAQSAYSHLKQCEIRRTYSPIAPIY